MIIALAPEQPWVSLITVQVYSQDSEEMEKLIRGRTTGRLWLRWLEGLWRTRPSAHSITTNVGSQQSWGSCITPRRRAIEVETSPYPGRPETDSQKGSELLSGGALNANKNNFPINEPAGVWRGLKDKSNQRRPSSLLVSKPWLADELNNSWTCLKSCWPCSAPPSSILCSAALSLAGLDLLPNRTRTDFKEELGS